MTCTAIYNIYHMVRSRLFCADFYSTILYFGHSKGWVVIAYNCRSHAMIGRWSDHNAHVCTQEVSHSHTTMGVSFEYVCYWTSQTAPNLLQRLRNHMSPWQPAHHLTPHPWSTPAHTSPHWRPSRLYLLGAEVTEMGLQGPWLTGAAGPQLPSHWKPVLGCLHFS